MQVKHDLLDVVVDLGVVAASHEDLPVVGEDVVGLLVADRGFVPDLQVNAHRHGSCSDLGTVQAALT